MNKTITITSKGQTTLPAAMRHKLGLSKNGGVLQISFNERNREIIISKSPSAADLSDRISSYIQPGKKPLLQVDEYYQTNRKTA